MRGERAWKRRHLHDAPAAVPGDAASGIRASIDVGDSALTTVAERAHVLVVEDDQDIRELVSEILTDEGYSVSSAANGLEALQLLARAPTADLILLDLMMPHMNGFQFRQAQLNDAALAAIPVIVLSADTHTQEKAESLGAAGFLKKPLAIEALLNTVTRTLRAERP